jgi:hypothetical protein
MLTAPDDAALAASVDHRSSWAGAGLARACFWNIDAADDTERPGETIVLARRHAR